MEMEGIFRKIDFFNGLDDKILKKVSEAAVLQQYGKGEVIVRQGEMGLGLYVILRGRVTVDREESGTTIRVAELGAEQFFAEMSVIDNRPRSATITTLEDTECMVLTRDSFMRLMMKYPEIPIRLARLLADRIRVVNQKLASGPMTGGPPSAAGAAPPPGIPQSAAAVAAAEPTSAAGPANASPDARPTTRPPSPNGTKARVQQALLQTFESLYMLKALTRFSVAVLGCPVEGAASNVAEQIRVGDVKALLFPAEEAVELDIAAYEAGSFTLHVFVPTRRGPLRFGPVSIRPEDRFQLSLRGTSIALRHGDRPIDPA